jgi:ABC-type multidrug transport system ATPase subunit
VPGPGVGYMPQELALFGDFTIEETLIYFGRLYGISEEVVNSRIDFMIGLLQLPNRTKLISHLSGGQKRRVSMATGINISGFLFINRFLTLLV